MTNEKPCFGNDKIIKNTYKKYFNYINPKDRFPIEDLLGRYRTNRPIKKDDFKIPNTPQTSPPTKTKKQDRKVILSPLDEVFFDAELMDDLIARTSVPQLLEGKLPIYPGVILFGPPGTGKSEFQKALCKVYENKGAYAKQISSSKINGSFVSQLAANLEKELEIAGNQGKSRGLPSFLSFDEGSIFAEQASNGANSVAKHYQEAIDVLKRYLGNDIGKYLVLAISTNALPEDFEDALTREGRLTSFFIQYPSKAQIAKMFQYFLSKNKVLDITNEQAQELAKIPSQTNGALISKFCESYFPHRRNQLLVQRGYNSLLDALKEGINIEDDEVRTSINYDQIRYDLKDYLEKLSIRNGDGNGNKNPEGFGFGTKRKANQRIR